MDPFIGQIVMFGGNFAPRDWAYCDGQLLAIAQHQALFSIIGTTYGGDGRSSFALPDLRGRVAIHPGTGPGLSTYVLGQRAGVESVILNVNQIPAHNHIAAGTIKCNFNPTTPATSKSPVDGTFAMAESNTYNTAAGDKLMADNGVNVTVNNTGGNQAHTNIQPFECVHYIIALQGTFPSRN